jgi:hypothetical protein
MSMNQDLTVIKYVHPPYEWYVDKFPLAGRALSMLCSESDADKLARDWLSETQVIIVALAKVTAGYVFTTPVTARL